MAMVYLKNHNENIYNVENEPHYQQVHHMGQQQMHQQKANCKRRESAGLYVSKFHNMVKAEVEVKRAAHRTMGFARTPLTSPCNFLKKNEGVRWKVSTDHKCIKNPIPRVPRRGELASAPSATSNDPQSPNQSQDMQALQQISSANTNNKKLNSRGKSSKKGERLQPKPIRPRFIDSCFGTSQDLFSSGLMPQYIFRPTYGKVPDYLAERRNQLAANNQYKKDTSKGYVQGGMENMTESTGTKYVSQEERLALLSGLKANWEKLQKRYQRLPVLTDTETKKIAKVNLERELKQLEQDIMLLENNPHIYVCDNSK